MAARKRRKRSAVDRAVFHMRPNRVLARYMSGGRHQTFKAIARSPFKSKTVATNATMRKQHQKWSRERAKQRSADRKVETEARRRQARDMQKAETAAARKRRVAQQASTHVINPRTGKPITWAQAQRAVREASARADRLAAGRDGDAPARRPRQAKTASATPLARAIADAQKKTPAKKATSKRAAPKRTATATRKPAKTRAGRKKVQPLAPILAGSPPPKLRRPGRNLTGIAMAVTCACQGTGRVIVYDKEGNPNGSTSCPEHGRSGARRGAKRWTTKGAIRDSGLPGLGAWLQKRRTKRRGNSDARQHKAWQRAHSEHRLAGPRLECEWCEGGVVERRLTKQLREQHIAKARAQADTDGKAVSERRLKADARRAFPQELCSRCKGLGVVATAVRLMPDGTQPVAEWRAGAGLKKGHRQTGRERATGKRKTENARRVDRSRLLP